MSASPVEPKPLPAELKYKKIEAKDRMKALDFLKRTFFLDEPLNCEIKLLQDENDRCEDLEQFCLDTIDQGLSIAIVDSKDNIIATGLYGINYKSDGLTDYSGICQHPRFKKILGLLYKINKDADVYNKLPGVDKIFEVKIISVDNAYRGRGLAYNLLHKAKEISKSNGVNILKAECTSGFSAKVMERLNGTKIFTMKFQDYKVDGKVVFDLKPPHDEVSVYYLKF